MLCNQGAVFLSHRGGDGLRLGVYLEKDVYDILLSHAARFKHGEPRLHEEDQRTCKTGNMTQ